MQPPVRAAEYVRMSTERQEYSIPYQQAANAAYAASHHYQIVRKYSDEGASGLTLAGRPGLRKLLEDALCADRTFDVILVYDVSRWGRFQNPDQAAHYEFLCHQAGVRIEYCAEPFDNDGSPSSGLLKHLKRAMAAEYSRELSARIIRARRSLAEQGFWVGGVPPFGYRRELFDASGHSYGVMETGDWSWNTRLHARLVLGPSAEVEAIRRVFFLYLEPGGTQRGVARQLNAEGVITQRGGPWSQATVRHVIDNQTYCGRLIQCRSSGVLGEPLKLRQTSTATWVVQEDAIPAIVSRARMAAAQRKRHALAYNPSDQELLAEIEALIARHGRLTEAVLRRSGRWSYGVYRRRFGGIQDMRSRFGLARPRTSEARAQAIQMAHASRVARGMVRSDEDLLKILRELLGKHGRLTTRIIEENPSTPNAYTFVRRFGGLANAYALVGYVPSGLQAAVLRATLPKKPNPLLYGADGRAHPQPKQLDLFELS